VNAPALSLPAPSVSAVLRRGLAGSPANAFVSAILLAGLAWMGWHAFTWAVLGAELRPDPQACRQVTGACWGAVAERGRSILLGRFPADSSWRPVLAMLLLAGAICVAALPRFFNRLGLLLVVAGLGAFVTLMYGGFAGLERVTTDLWGGLPLTLFLSAVACLAGIPLGILFALGRRGRFPLVRWVCTTYIELVRAVPLITLLFFGAVVMPLVLPPDMRWDPMVRIAVCLVMFEAAYFAEVIRGGLQAVPKGQYEAAQALGLGTAQTMRLIVLPQALRFTIPPTVSNVIGVLKNTSLVAVVNVFDLTGALKMALAVPEWKAFHVELYALVVAVYLALGLTIAAYGRFLERRYAMHHR
jgi:general L-amino acid transport system permease protein